MARERAKVIQETNVMPHLLTTRAEVRLAARASGVGLRPLRGRTRTTMATPQQLARQLQPLSPNNNSNNNNNQVRTKVRNNNRHS